jgi:hypothetical protein
MNLKIEIKGKRIQLAIHPAVYFLGFLLLMTLMLIPLFETHTTIVENRTVIVENTEVVEPSWEVTQAGHVVCVTSGNETVCKEVEE